MKISKEQLRFVKAIFEAKAEYFAIKVQPIYISLTPRHKSRRGII